MRGESPYQRIIALRSLVGRAGFAALPALLGVALAAPVALAQQQGRVIAMVTDSSGSPVSHATVTAPAARSQTRTDDRGIFRLNYLPLGQVEVVIRRLGFDPVTVALEVKENTYDTTRIVLVDDRIELAAVNVAATASRQRKNIEAFYDRAANGIGTYVTRDDILARKASQTIDLFRGIPGLRVVRGRGIDGVRFQTSSQMRRDCIPMVWLDGQRAPGLEVGDVPVHDLEGIEMYNGPSTTPMQFSQGPSGGSCGVVVFWTRPPPPAQSAPRRP